MPYHETVSAEEIQRLVGAGVLLLAHLWAPTLMRLRERVAPIAQSFAGGLAVAYVFVHLLPELELGHELLGQRIYVLVLAGFLLVYGIEHGLSRRTDDDPGPVYAVRLGVAAVYNALVVFTLGAQIPDSLVLALVFLGSLSLHIVSMDHGLQEQFEGHHRRSRVVLMLAVVGGAAASLRFEGHELEVDIATALLAGFIMWQVFRDELPKAGRGRFGWLLAGASFMLACELLAG